jgi:hypothetical protein
MRSGGVTLQTHARRKQTTVFCSIFSDFHLNDLGTKNGEKNISNNNVKQKNTPHSQIMRSRAI